MTSVNWRVKLHFLVGLTIRAPGQGSCLAPGCAEVVLRAETRTDRRSNGKSPSATRFAVLRATLVQAGERLNAGRFIIGSFPGHWEMSSKFNELRPVRVGS
jgi:hypothetical protein